MVEDKEENWPVALGMARPRGLLALIECFSPVIVWPGARVVLSHSGFIRCCLHSVVFIPSQQPRCLSWSEVSFSWLSLVTGTVLVQKPLPQGSWQWIEEEGHILCLLAFFWDSSQGPLQLQGISQGLSYTLWKGQDFLLSSANLYTEQVSVDLKFSSLGGGPLPTALPQRRLSSRREPNISGTSVSLGVLISIVRYLLG